MSFRNERPPLEQAHGRPARAALACLLLACTFLAPPLRAADPAPAPAPAKDSAAPDVVVDEKTARIIDGALKYLASKQAVNGAWSPGEHPVAMTAYTLLAFLSAGQLPDEGEYGKNVSRGVQYLLDCVNPDGYVAENTGGESSRMYGHGIATIALAEAYGQSRLQTIRPKLERAVRLIVSCQNKEGGWRYVPRVSDADISVTVLQVVALRAAKNAGLDVPQETIDRAVKYVRSCHDERSGGFTYQPHNHDPGFARTAAAVYSLQVCGQYDDPTLKRASEYLVEKFGDKKFFSYGNFYAAPAQYMIGGETWRKWYEKVGGMLKAQAKPAPGLPGGFFWEPLDGEGRVHELYSTAVYTTILAMPYHYLPLYQR